MQRPLDRRQTLHYAPPVSGFLGFLGVTVVVHMAGADDDGYLERSRIYSFQTRSMEALRSTRLDLTYPKEKL